MQATNYNPSSPMLCPISLSSSPRKRKPFSLIVNASRERKGRHYGGRLVDENMIVLRVRMKDLKMQETKEEPPSNWMEWEKQYYAYYDEDVCEAVGHLQSYLMSIRPSLALGMVALVTLSVPISTGVVLFHIIEMAKRILSGCMFF
ncbi:uncharacterized protein LOC126699694 [Quercus robur]|uniref:uncharacterized protein LOC126699694 n=1 Tax=Quercus robur TaxID=38942 RepID=UPI0021615BE3|nr:uncharacterized protein LOC126699694 [Quercus robur]